MNNNPFNKNVNFDKVEHERRMIFIKQTTGIFLAFVCIVVWFFSVIIMLEDHKKVIRDYEETVYSLTQEIKKTHTRCIVESARVQNALESVQKEYMKRNSSQMFKMSVNKEQYTPLAFPLSNK